MLCDRLHFSERRACRLGGQHRSTQRHAPSTPGVDDADLRAQLRAIAERKTRWGYRRAHGQLRQDGWTVNRKRVQRLWREEGLRVPQKARKRRRTADPQAQWLRADRPNQLWAMDFQYDQTGVPPFRAVRKCRFSLARGRVLELHPVRGAELISALVLYASDRCYWTT